MKKVFETVKMHNLVAKNRLVRSATWEAVAAEDGSINDEAYNIYRDLADGGVGTIITGFTSVSQTDHYFGGIMRLGADFLIPQYKKLTDIIHKHGAKAIAQLALGAYYRPMENGQYQQTEPDLMTEKEIEQVIDSFVEAAHRSRQAGFDGVQIHMAHFFFLSRFVSPAINHRTDKWGGSTENRMRIVLEILKRIKAENPAMHISVKTNSSDFCQRGLEPEETLQMALMLADAGIDSIEVSGNGTSVGGIKAHRNEGYFAGYAAQLAKMTKVPVIVVGGFRALDTMEAVISQTDIQLISLSRPLVREPNLPKLMQEGKKIIADCVSCNACYNTPGHRCIFILRKQKRNEK